MGTDIYIKHGLHIRRIALGYDRGPGYEIHAREMGSRLTHTEFKKMVFALLKHLMEVKG